LAAGIHLYLDENITPKVAAQLRRRGISATSVHELGLTGDSDANHLERAIAMQWVLVTCDIDFLVMAAEGAEHSGIVFGIQEEMSVGDWVTRFEMLCAVYDIEDMRNHVEYL
jgi:hypothetical protein